MTGKDPAFKTAQALLAEITNCLDLTLPTFLVEKQEANTHKFLLKTSDNLEVESVLIPMQAGGTLCISSQVGCRMACSFCETGRMGLLRNLTTEEIVSQVFTARHRLGMDIRNVVFMGMGEPFDNFDAVLQAYRVLNDDHGLNFAKNHVTVSTSGCVEGIYRLAEQGPNTPNLAVSINAPDDALRNRLMPINRKHDMQALYEAMSHYCSTTGRQILAAYVLLKDCNDSLEHADQLAHYLKGLDVKVNLIPYNPQSKDRYQPPEEDKIEAFLARLRSHGYTTLLRVTKGREIMAGCGQLGNLQLRKNLIQLAKNI